jgi:flagellar hook-associated protein 3 FlgL
MAVRVSDSLRYATTENRISAARAFADDTQETAISGRRVRNISTDPVAAIRLFRNQAKQNNIVQFKKSIDFAKGYLGRTEDALQGINDSLIRAKELAIQQSNSTWDAQSREIVSKEVKQIADQLVQLGNSTFGDKYVFGGFRSHLPPIGNDGSYLGDDGSIFIQMDEDTFKAVNVPGSEVFGVPSEKEQEERPIVKSVREFAIALENNNPEGIHKSMVDIDAALKRVIQATATLGSRTSALQEVSNKLEHTEIRLIQDDNNLQESDPIKSAMELKRAENAIQMTLNSSAKLLEPSLMNFLK